MLILEVIGARSDLRVPDHADGGGAVAGYFELKEGSLYPALHRMERQKLLRASWSEADGRRRKYYELTDAGRAELAARKRSWQSFAAGVSGVLGISRVVSRLILSPTLLHAIAMDYRDTLSADLPRPGMTSRPACGRTSSTSWPTTWPAPYNRELTAGVGCERGATTCVTAVWRSGGRGAPALARCDRRQDHGSAHACWRPASW